MSQELAVTANGQRVCGGSIEPGNGSGSIRPESVWWQHRARNWQWLRACMLVWWQHRARNWQWLQACVFVCEVLGLWLQAVACWVVALANVPVSRPCSYLHMVVGWGSKACISRGDRSCGWSRSGVMFKGVVSDPPSLHVGGAGCGCGRECGCAQQQQQWQQQHLPLCPGSMCVCFMAIGSMLTVPFLVCFMAIDSMP